MKHLLHLAPLMLILGACAPKAILVEEADVPAEPTTASKPAGDHADGGDLPNFGHDDGLLDPHGLANMPSDRDMKSTVQATNTAVIANPPEGDKATNE